MIGNIFSDPNLFVNIDNNNELVYDEYAINQSILTILGTTRGSRLFRPDFGASLYAMLFEPMTDASASKIRNAIIVAIENWETRITLTNSSVVPSYSEQTYYVTLNYIIPQLQDRAASFAFSLVKQN